jgi:hypothetical protein
MLRFSDREPVWSVLIACFAMAVQPTITRAVATVICLVREVRIERQCVAQGRPGSCPRRTCAQWLALAKHIWQAAR